MKIQNQFKDELSKLTAPGPATVTVVSPPRKLSCSTVARDSLAVSFNDLRLSTPELANTKPADLERIGSELAGRLTYLMEPIAPIELDEAACIVQLRSNPPQRDDDGRSYYELLVRRGGEITLARYRKETGASRQQVAATVTREVLLRLVSDFCAVLE
jgi:hypothetical protein